jgi:hypothetical protein
MGKTQNLTEEIYRMRKLMNFDSKEYVKNTTSFDTLVEESFIKEKINNNFLLTEEDDFDWEKDLLLMEQEEQNQEQTEEDNVFEEIPDEDIMNTPEFEEFVKELIEPSVSDIEIKDSQDMDKLIGKKILTANEKDGTFGYFTIENAGEMGTQTSGNTQTNESLDLVNEGIEPREWDYKEYWKDMICLKDSNCVWHQKGADLFIWKNKRYNQRLFTICNCSRKNKFCCGLSKVLVWFWRRIVDSVMFPTMVVWTAGVGLWKLVEAAAKGIDKAFKWLKKKFKQWFRKRPKKYKRFIRVWVDKKGKDSFAGSRLRIGVRRYVTIGKSENGSSLYIDKVGDEAAKLNIPPNEWDNYIKENQKYLLKRMDATSKENWKSLLAEPDDPNDNREDGNKEYAVFVIQEFLEKRKEYDWKYVTVGNIGWMKDIKEPEEEETGENYELPYSVPDGGTGSNFFVDNEFGLTAELSSAVNKIAEAIDTQMKSMEGVPWKDGWKAYVTEIKIESSASRFRNTEGASDMSFAELAEKRMKTAEDYIRETLLKLEKDGQGKQQLVIDNGTNVIKDWKGSNGDGTSGPNPPDQDTKYLIVKDIESGKESGVENWITADELKKNEYFMKKYGRIYFKSDGTLKDGNKSVSSGRINSSKKYPNGYDYRFVPKGNYKMTNWADCSLDETKEECETQEGTPTWRGECGEPHGSKKEYEKYKYTKISIKVTYNGVREIPDKPNEEPGKVEIISGGRYPVTFSSPPKGGFRIPIIGAELKIRWKPPKGGSGVVKGEVKKTKGCPEAYGG